MKGAEMKRILVVVLILCCTVSIQAADTAAAGIKGALQAGIGAANVAGGPEFGLSYQVFTLQATGLYFPSKWATVIADFSYGLPSSYEYKHDGDTDEVKAQSSYLDGMVGVYKTFSDGGFVYLGAGATVGFGVLEVTNSDGSSYEFDLKTSVGLVYGAGLALPITDAFMGFVNVRQRFIKAELELEPDGTRTYDMSNSGMEMVIGLGWTFGS